MNRIRALPLRACARARRCCSRPAAERRRRRRTRSRSSTETFSNPTPIKSGNFDLDFKIETNGGESPGTLEVKLGGKFQSQASGSVPAVRLRRLARAESGSQTLSGSGGLTSTGDRAFVNIQGTEYAVPAAALRRVHLHLRAAPGPERLEPAGTGLLQSAQHRPGQVAHRSEERGHRGRRGHQDDPHLRQGERPADRRRPEDDRPGRRQRGGERRRSASSTSSTASIQSGDVDVNSGQRRQAASPASGSAST